MSKPLICGGSFPDFVALSEYIDSNLYGKQMCKFTMYLV